MRTIRVKIVSKGIGDTLLALTTCYGLKVKYPEDKIVYSTCNVAWAEIFKPAYDEITHEHAHVEADITYSPYDSYRLELWQGRYTRSQYYSRFCGGVEPKMPPHVELDLNQFKDHIVLVPFSESTNRNWLIQNWLELEQALIEKGYGVVIMAKTDFDLDRFISQRLTNLPPYDAASIIKHAKCVVSSDTGMMHLAGLLGTKGIVMTAGITGDKIYELYPTVKVIEGGLGCNNCRWLHTVEKMCIHWCASLQQISIKQIIEAIQS